MGRYLFCCRDVARSMRRVVVVRPRRLVASRWFGVGVFCAHSRADVPLFKFFCGTYLIESESFRGRMEAEGMYSRGEL